MEVGSDVMKQTDVVGGGLCSDDSLHVHDRLKTVPLDEQIVLGLLLLPLTDDGSVHGRDTLQAKKHSSSQHQRKQREDGRANEP